MGGGTKSPENLDRVVRFSTQGPFDTAVAGLDRRRVVAVVR